MRSKRLLLALVILVVAATGAVFFAFRQMRQDENTSRPRPVKTMLSDAFTSDTCANPCWLGIEVGVTDQEAAQNILDTQGIRYEWLTTPPAYNIHLAESSLPLWFGMIPERAVGSIYLEGSRVSEMNFGVDLCISTVIKTFGTPRAIRESPPWEAAPTLYMHYADYGLRFRIDESTQKVNRVYLLPVELMNDVWPPESLEAWEPYADQFSAACIDILSE